MATNSLVVHLTVSLRSPKMHYGKIILQCASKTCELDVIPTTLLFECLDAILPTFTDVLNHSVLTGEFLLIFKKTIVNPLLKTTSLDPEDVKST